MTPDKPGRAALLRLGQMDNVFRQGTPRQMKWVDALHRANYNSMSVNQMAEILIDLADDEIDRALRAIRELVDEADATGIESGPPLTVTRLRAMLEPSS